LPVTRRPYRSERRSAAAAETRQRILDAAQTMLAEDNGGDFSMDAVARRAAVTRATVYNQFETKAGLLTALFDNIARRSVPGPPRPARTPGDPAEELRALIANYCAYWNANRVMFPRLRAVVTLMADPDVQASLSERVRRQRGTMADILARLLGRPPEEELLDLVFALSSFEMFSLLSAEGRPADQVAALVQRQVELTIADRRAA
jgi:AcrR family transcriptional regulator